MSHQIIPINVQNNINNKQQSQTNQAIFDQNQHKKVYKHTSQQIKNSHQTTTVVQQQQSSGSFIEEERRLTTTNLDDCSPIRNLNIINSNEMNNQHHNKKFAGQSSQSREQDLSPIKPSFVGNQNQLFGHSTPNQHLLQSPNGKQNKIQQFPHMIQVCVMYISRRLKFLENLRKYLAI